MGLEEQIAKEEEELKKLAKAEEDGENEEDLDNDDDNTDDDAIDDDEETGEEDDGTEDDSKDDDDSDEDGDGNDTDDDSDDGEDNADDNGVKDKKNPAKDRIERKKRLKLEEENAELRRKLEEGRQAQDNHDKEKDPPKKETAEERLDRIESERETERLRAQAADELSDIETEFAKEHEDYKDAATHMVKGLYGATRQLYPHLTEKQAIQAVQNKVLGIASQAARNGQNPAEVLYQMSFDRFGFDPDKVQKADDAPGKKKTNAADTLKKKAKNRKRSANGLTGGGQSAGARVTIDEAKNMSLADFGNMSETEIDDLIAQANE